MLQYWLSYLTLAAIAYWLPGFALARLVDLRGMGRSGRLLLSVLVSLVAVPLLLVMASNLTRIVPSLGIVLLISLMAILFEWYLTKNSAKPAISFVSIIKDPGRARGLERVLVLLFILGFSFTINMPRLSL